MSTGVRELSCGARQWKGNIELTLELLSEMSV